jgi:hypothetical protein
METNSAPSTRPLRKYRETVRQSRGECKVIITSWMSAEARALLTDRSMCEKNGSANTFSVSSPTTSATDPACRLGTDRAARLRT